MVKRDLHKVRSVSSILARGIINYRKITVKIEITEVELAYLTCLVGRNNQLTSEKIFSEYKNEKVLDYSYQKIINRAEPIDNDDLFHKLKILVDGKDHHYKLLLKSKHNGEFSLSWNWYKSTDDYPAGNYEVISIVKETEIESSTSGAIFTISK